MLTKEGEKFTEEELKGYLDVLLGPNVDLPQTINVNNFTDEILGFEDLESTEKIE